MKTFEVPFFENSLSVTYTTAGVVEVVWKKKSVSKATLLSGFEKKFHQSLHAYLKGSEEVDFKIDWQNLRGTEFQKSVWKKMIKIPYGQTKSYGEIAQSLDRPGAARAVGTACGKNPVLLAIPCHRVVGRQGLGGFSGGGIPIKKRLLALENSLQ